MTDPAGRLVVVDMQRIFAAGPWRAPRFAQIVPTVHKLAARFGPRTTFTRFIAPEQPAGAWAAYYAQWPFARQPADAPDWAIVDELAEQATDTVDATTFGKWPALNEHAPFEAGQQVAVCGVSTDCCVISTVLAAADAGMAVQVVSDACAGIDDASHAKALDIMALYAPLVQVVRSDDVLGG